MELRKKMREMCKNATESCKGHENANFKSFNEHKVQH